MVKSRERVDSHIIGKNILFDFETHVSTVPPDWLYLQFYQVKFFTYI